MLKGISRKTIPRDIFTGIIIALVSIPISMGYAQIAGLPKPVINRANEILFRLESDDGQQKLNETSVPTEQLLLFPETNPILDALRDLDVDNLSPIEAINMLYTWKHKFE